MLCQGCLGESGNTVLIDVLKVPCLVCGLLIVVTILNVAVAASFETLKSRI